MTSIMAGDGANWSRSISTTIASMPPSTASAKPASSSARRFMGRGGKSGGHAHPHPRRHGGRRAGRRLRRIGMNGHVPWRPRPRLRRAEPVSPNATVCWPRWRQAGDDPAQSRFDDGRRHGAGGFSAALSLRRACGFRSMPRQTASPKSPTMLPVGRSAAFSAMAMASAS